MKRRFVFLSFILFLVSGAFAITPQINLYEDPKPKDPKPHSMIYNPVSVTISGSDLIVLFDFSAGNATITVYDSTNTIVHQELVNTSSTTEVYIPVNLWDAGDYSITISYGTTNMINYFQIP